jgi:hypothetical protein
VDQGGLLEIGRGIGVTQAVLHAFFAALSTSAPLSPPKHTYPHAADPPKEVATLAVSLHSVFAADLPHNSESLFFASALQNAHLVAPRLGIPVTPYRLNCYRNVGRMVGICLLQQLMSPLRLHRHVLKFMLGRDVNLHDISFVDRPFYDQMVALLARAESADITDCEFNAFVRESDLSFEITDDSRKNVDLIPGGATIPVSRDNVAHFIELYVRHRLVECVRLELEALRDGFADVLPVDLVSRATLEDISQFMNGRTLVHFSDLQKAVRFEDGGGVRGYVISRLTKM